MTVRLILWVVCLSVCLSVCDVGVLWLNASMDRVVFCLHQGYLRGELVSIRWESADPPTERQISPRKLAVGLGKFSPWLLIEVCFLATVRHRSSCSWIDCKSTFMVRYYSSLSRQWISCHCHGHTRLEEAAALWGSDSEKITRFLWRIHELLLYEKFWRVREQRLTFHSTPLHVMHFLAVLRNYNGMTAYICCRFIPTTAFLVTILLKKNHRIAG